VGRDNAEQRRCVRDVEMFRRSWIREGATTIGFWLRGTSEEWRREVCEAGDNNRTEIKAERILEKEGRTHAFSMGIGRSITSDDGVTGGRCRGLRW